MKHLENGMSIEIIGRLDRCPLASHVTDECPDADQSTRQDYAERQVNEISSLHRKIRQKCLGTMGRPLGRYGLGRY